MESLHVNFKEHELDSALVTESWLKHGSVLNRKIIDLEWGSDLKNIYKNRLSSRSGARRLGGGVSIIYRKSTCTLR